VQDRDGILLVLDRRTRRFFPFIECIFADAAYQGPKTVAAIAKIGTWKLAIVKRNELHRFLVLPKRWIVTVRTMLPSQVLSGHRSSNAGAADGNRSSLR
jgi:transposase